MDTNYEDLMAGGDIFQMSKKIINQAWDRGKVARKIGGRDELIQQVCKILLEVRAGEVVFDPGRNVSFNGFVMEKARWIARENWMLEAPRRRNETAQPKMPDDAPADDEEADEKVEVARLQTVTPRCGGGGRASGSRCRTRC